MSVELRPVGGGERGRRTGPSSSASGCAGVVVMGDDVTDLDMFIAVAELRASGAVRGAIIGVGGEDGEVPPAVAQAADVVLGDPIEAASLLHRLAGG